MKLLRERPTGRRNKFSRNNAGYSSQDKITTTRGAEFEQRTARFLQQQGFSIVARNFRCKLGEIDLIARDEHRLLFVEVRARKSRSHGSAASTVASQKQCKIKKCAAFFLQKNPQWAKLPCRFDVITWEPTAVPRTNEPPQARSTGSANSQGHDFQEHCFLEQYSQQHYFVHWIPGAFLA